MEHLK